MTKRHSRDEINYNDFMRKAKSDFYGEQTKKQKEQREIRNALINELGDVLSPAKILYSSVEDLKKMKNELAARDGFGIGGGVGWCEEDHPRDDDGKFTFKNGGDEDTDDEKTDNLPNNVVLKGSVRYDAPLPSSKIPETYTPPVKIERPTGSLAKGNWQKPVNYIRVSSPYGWRYHPIKKRNIFHQGVDMAAPANTPVITPMDGVVISAKWEGAYGNCVRIKHKLSDGSEVVTVYAHLNGYTTKNGTQLKTGQQVKQGEQIGKVGSTGRDKNGKPTSTGNHLHFEVRKNDKTENPFDYIKTLQ